MGVVYKAFDTLIKRPVAVKTLHDIRDTAALELFYKEWGVLASLVHPNIVQVYDVGKFESQGETVPFFVMPLLPGATLRELIYEQSCRLSVTRAVDIVCQACRGIQAAHEAKLVHRDIKPSNILVLDDDSVKIIDFGVAHLVGKEGSTGLKGTPYYMAPEQIRMQGPSALTDIYSLGVVAYEALTGRRPIQGSSDSEIAEAIVSHIPPAASEVNPAVDQVMSRVLHKAMAKHPWHRFSSAREFGEALQKALRGEPIEIFDPSRIRPRIEKAQRAFEAGEFAFASEVVAELEGEGCLDQEIVLLRRKLDALQRKNRIRELVEGARHCLNEQEYTLALRKVREALELDPDDGEVLSLKSRIETASSSQKTAAENKREEAIAWCLSKALRLREEGKSAEALQLVERVLETYPGAARLEELRQALRPLVAAGASDATPTDDRASDLEELERIAQLAAQPGSAKVTRGLEARVEEIGRKWLDDKEIRLAVDEALRRLRDRSIASMSVGPVSAKPPGRAATANGDGAEAVHLAEVSDAAGGAMARLAGEDASIPAEVVPSEPSAAARHEMPAGSADRQRTPAQRPAAAPGARISVGAVQVWLAEMASRAAAWSRQGSHNIYVWIGGALAVGLALAALILSFLGGEAPPPPAPTAEVQVNLQPAGAKLVLTGSGESFECASADCRLTVPAGDYTLNASLAGYRPWHERVSLASGAVTPLAMTLEPMPVVLRLVSDLEQASVRIDGEEIDAPLDQDVLGVELKPGTYPVQVRGGAMSASMVVDVAPGRAPRVVDAIKAHELQVYVVASFGGSGELRSSSETVAVQIDGQESGAASGGVLRLAALSPGLHELAFTTDAGQMRRSFEVGEEPTLTAVLVTDRNLGSLVVDAGVAGAEVTIDDGRYHRETGSGGTARFRLAPGEYRVSVQKAGHEAVAPQAFTIRKGDETRLKFELPVKPQMARLEIAGAPSGAEVWVDEQRAGEVDRSGAFSTSVPAGSHRIALRNLPEMYQSQSLEKQFPEGGSVALGEADLPLRAVKGRVQVQVEPTDASATVTIKREGGAEEKIQAGTHYREPGDYVISAAAPGYQRSEVGRRVTAGQTAVFHLTLTREAVRAPEHRLGLADLGKIEGFESKDGMMVRNGGEFALLPLSPSAGTYTFTANARGGGIFSLRHVGIGKPRIEWVVDYTDDGDYVLFEFGENALSRTVVNGGKRGETVKIPHECPKADYYALSVEVAADAAASKALCKGQWVVLDRWQPQGANLADGKFGFFVPNKSTLAVSHFEAVGR